MNKNIKFINQCDASQFINKLFNSYTREDSEIILYKMLTYIRISKVIPLIPTTYNNNKILFNIKNNLYMYDEEKNI